MKGKFTTAELFFNAAAIISMFASVSLWFLDYRMEAIFVGIWVPTIVGWMNFFSRKEARARDVSDASGSVASPGHGAEGRASR